MNRPAAEPPEPAPAPPSVFDGPGYEMIAAIADLCSRTGAPQLDIGYRLISPENRVTEWYAVASFDGTELTEDGHGSLASACYALAVRMVEGSDCVCGLKVKIDPGPYVLTVGPDGERWGMDPAASEGCCLWQQTGQQWHPGCGLLPVETEQQGELEPTQAPTG